MEKREKFLPYNLPSVGEEEIAELVDTIRSNWLTMGPKTMKLEKQIEDYIGVKHAIAVNSCTAGLHLSLIVSGIGAGDEVIVPAYTFASTANVVEHSGAKPVFVDIEEKTFNLDPQKVRGAITPKTKAIMVVHYGGGAADLDELMKISREFNIPLIEDAAHAIGVEYNGKKIGAFGNLTSYSFYVTKNMTTGEGGAIVTNDDTIADRLRILRLHGISKDAWKRYGKGGSFMYGMEECGWKYNMTDLQASLGVHQIRKLDSFIQKRQELARQYDQKLSKLSGVKIPPRPSNVRHVIHLYPILLENYERNKFVEEMKELNIGTSVHFIPLPLHPFYKEKYGFPEGEFPVSERVYKQEVSLPLYPGMTSEDVDYVVEAVESILQRV